MSKIYYCFTTSHKINDDPEKEFEYLFTHRSMTWVGISHEVGENGYNHWQGECAFSKEVAFTAKLRKFFDGRHVEPMKRLDPLDTTYCGKAHGGKFQFERGIRPRQGVSANMDLLYVQIKEHKIRTVHEAIALVGFAQFARSDRSIRALLKEFQPRELRNVEVHVHWGASGVGKSMQGFKQGAIKMRYRPKSDFFLGNYNGEDIIQIDEFKGQMDFEDFLDLTDIYPYDMNIKGSSVPLLAKKIILTSNKDPAKWYNDPDGAFKRRITSVTYYAPKISEPKIVSGVVEPAAETVLPPLNDF